MLLLVYNLQVFSFSVLFGDDDCRPPVYWGLDAGAFMHLE